MNFAQLTTLRLGGPARRLIEARTEAELVEAVLGVDESEPLFVLGGGSNLVVADAGFDGTVVRVMSRGVRELDADTGHGVQGGTASATRLLEVAAGETWDLLVAGCVERGWAGIETLSGIPGTVGAAPMQNIGAYGQSVADSVRSVKVLDRELGEVVSLAAADCGFGYRDSRFKRELDRFVVLSVVLELAESGSSQPVTHRELAAQLGIELGERAPLEAVRAAVIDVRSRKGMVLDSADHDTWSAGSFFVNPVLEPEAYEQLGQRAREIVGESPPSYPEAGGSSKVPAAWVIERSGFSKGYPLARRPDAGIAISTKHPLALTNRGSGTSAELLMLAREIIAGVQSRFGVALVPEPRLLGFGERERVD